MVSCGDCKDPKDCPFCDDGKVILSGASVLEYKDSRSMLRSDGQTFLCGTCIHGPDGKCDVLLTAADNRPLLMKTDISLKEASDVVGRRRGWMFSMAIVDSRSSHSADMEFQRADE